MTEQHDDRKPGSVKPRISAMERLQIQSGLDSASSLYAIGKTIGRSVRTITREVIARAKMTATGPALRLANKCVHRFDCLKRRICAICLHRRSRPCRLCNQCNTHCADYVEDECGRLSKPPYVCNGCAERSKCVLTKRLYRADEAQKDYESKLSEPRRGVNLSEEEIARFDGILRELTGKGQSPHAIMANNRDLFTIGERSLYAYINSGILMTKRGDLPRACSIKPCRGEFTDPLALECPAGAVSGDLDPRLVEMFYCDPYSAWQKAFVERNHEFVRYVLPKATHYTEAASFDDLTQSDVELLMSHVNCYPRRILKDKTPYELFTDWIGEDVASKVFGIRRIEPNEVTLKPSLLGIDIRIKEWVNSVDAAPSPKAK
jgi:IS30 family transposase